MKRGWLREFMKSQEFEFQQDNRERDQRKQRRKDIETRSKQVQANNASQSSLLTPGTILLVKHESK